MDLVAAPSGHAGTTLKQIRESLAAAFSTTRPPVERAGASRDSMTPNMDTITRHRDFHILKSLLDSLSDLLAQSRLLDIIQSRMR